MTNLETKMSQFSNVSLRKVILTLGGTYNLALKASKKPISGVPYDPTNFNYDEVEAYLVRKFGEDWFTQVDWEALNTESVRVVRDEVKLEIGNMVTLRTSDLLFTVVFTTPTHLVISPLDESISTQPRVMTIDTFLHQGGKLVTPEAVTTSDRKVIIAPADFTEDPTPAPTPKKSRKTKKEEAEATAE
jgi:hypothetical protein